MSLVNSIDLQTISNLVEVIPNFPEDGIYFRDISPLLGNYEARTATFDMMYDLVKDLHIDCVAGIESRGFIFGVALAERLKCQFAMVRKPGNVPNPIIVEYGLEYRKKSALCIKPGIIGTGKNVLIVDDIFATGGSALATCELIAEKAKANVVGILCFAELYGLEKQTRPIYDPVTQEVTKLLKVENFNVQSLLKYSAKESSKFISRRDQLFRAKKTNYFPLEYPFLSDNRVIVFSHPSMKSLADGIVAKSMNYRSGSIHWGSFPDGLPNIKFEHTKYLENKKIVFILDIQNKHLLLEQISMLMVLSDQFIESLDVIIPYFAPGTMERVEEEGTLATAETTSTLISTLLPPTKKGRPTLRIFDLHTLHNRFYFSKNVVIKMESAIGLLKQRIPTDITIVFPDDGAHKRFRKQFEGYKIVVCSKVRGHGDERIIQIKDTYNISHDNTSYLDSMIIVDDLVQTGGTLEECRKALVKMGAKQVSCYVTHAVFPKMAYKKFLNGEFYKFYITNTIPEVSSKLENVSPFEVIHIENEIIRSLDFSYQFSNTFDEIKHLNVYVASTNQTKMTATYVALKELLNKQDNVKIHLYGIAVPSEVPEQPVGEQTYQGCANRLANLEEYVTHYVLPYDLLVAVENGVGIENDRTFDFAVVKIKSLKGEVLVESEHKTFFPKEYYNKSIEHSQTVTVGNLIERHMNIKPGTWHEKFGKKTREQDLSETIAIALHDNSLCLNFV